MPNRKPLATFWAVSWTLIILVACWTPSNHLPDEEMVGFEFHVPDLDKVIHATMFAGFGFLWMHAGRPWPRRAAWVVGIGLALAVVTELGQLTAIVGRDASAEDFAADAVGLLLAVGGVLLMERRTAAAAARAPETLKG